MVLMAIVDYDYKFIAIDVVGNGKDSDGGIFEASAMGQRFSSNTMNLPEDRSLPHQNVSTPCVLLGDQAFALAPYLVRPCPSRVS